MYVGGCEPGKGKQRKMPSFQGIPELGIGGSYGYSKRMMAGISITKIPV